MDFAENLKRICDEKGTTPTALCKELGLSTSKVSAWYGGSLPKQDVMVKLAKKLDCSVMDFFYDGEDDTQLLIEVMPKRKDEDLEELEENRRELEGQIAHEEMKKPLLSKERIIFWLYSFRNGSIEDENYKRTIIDTLVNSIYVYDTPEGGRKIVFTFNISGNNTTTVECLS